MVILMAGHGIHLPKIQAIKIVYGIALYIIYEIMIYLFNMQLIGYSNDWLEYLCKSYDNNSNIM